MKVVDATTAFGSQLATRGQVTRLIETVGCLNFANTVMEVIDQFLPIGHFSALIQDTTSTSVRVVAAASRSSDMTSSTLAQIYARQYFRNDPAGHSNWSEHTSQHVSLTHLRSCELSNPQYRRECYDKPGIIERLSLRCGHGDRIESLNFYRTHQEGPFDATDYNAAIETAALLLPFIRRHRAIIASPATNRGEALTRFSRRLENLPNRLTQREIEVCSRALIGMSVEATALDLGIRATSITTYRQRAYHKLGISSQNELFALVLH